MITVDMESRPVKKCRAIIRFGPETPVSGMRPAEYYQVTIDPNMASPDGRFIRFGNYRNDELVGWQRVEAMTVCEILEETPKVQPESRDGYVETANEISMNCVVHNEE